MEQSFNININNSSITIDDDYIIYYDNNIRPSPRINSDINNIRPSRRINPDIINMLFYLSTLDIQLEIENEEYNMALEQSLNEYKYSTRKPNINLNYKKNIYKNIDSDCKTCTICLTGFIENDTITFLNCKHIFHEKCLNEWVKYNSVCPVCRSSVEITCNDNDVNNHNQDDK